ncbi:MAG: hypothetical protein HC911_15895 [Chloroflexaceae bacterium]|nr:hypothetical protein [Chloroflexaceae bacterium]
MTAHAFATLSTSNEWYTPPHILDRAWRVLGGIDLDPASCAEANAQVQAARYFTSKDDGLAHDWHGRVWLNPPYGRGRANHAAFVGKLLTEYRVGRVQAACVLVRSATSEAWFQPLWQFPICFVRGRVRFLSPSDGAARAGNTHGTAIAGVGVDRDRFIAEFAPLGAIFLPILKTGETTG